MYVTGAAATALALLILAGMKPLEQRVVRRRTAPTSARLGLELDAALLPVREVVVSLQGAGLQVQRVRFRPGSTPGRQELDLTYAGETDPEAFVELLENLQKLTGVHRVTSAAAAINNVHRLDGKGSAGT